MANCSAPQTGLIPLNDLGAGLYLGKYKGGLYRGGLNVTPALHLSRGVAIAANVVPINGKVTMACLGFSSTNQVFDYVMSQAAVDVALSPDLRLVNLAHGGMDSHKISDPFSIYWSTHIPEAFTAASVSWEDVQVIWLRTADRADDDPPPRAFPASSWALASELKRCLQNAHYFFPNLKMAFLSSTMYMGYWDGGAIPMEPHNYETAFSIRRVIEDQIRCDPELNFDPSHGVVRAPWVDWGFYPWCDGATPRVDGLTWICPDDVQDEGQHPTNVGRAKIAARLITHWKAHAACASWFLA